MLLNEFAFYVSQWHLATFEVSRSLHVEFWKRQRWGVTAEPFLAWPQGRPVGFQLCLPAYAWFPGSGLFFLLCWLLATQLLPDSLHAWVEDGQEGAGQGQASWQPLGSLHHSRLGRCCETLGSEDVWSFLRGYH